MRCSAITVQNRRCKYTTGLYYIYTNIRDKEIWICKLHRGLAQTIGVLLKYRR